MLPLEVSSCNCLSTMEYNRYLDVVQHQFLFSVLYLICQYVNRIACIFSLMALDLSNANGILIRTQTKLKLTVSASV